MEKKPMIYSTDPLAAIMELDTKLDKCVSSFEERLQTASTTSTPTAFEQLAADFKQFKIAMSQSIELIRTQMTHITAAVDEIENRSRRKFLLFRGVNESKGEDIRATIASVILNKLKVVEFDPSSICFCYRIGKDSTIAGRRPVLVRFNDRRIRGLIWQSKKELKGCEISLAEYLTSTRRTIFNEARKVYGVHKCWSQEGNVYLITADGAKHRLVSLNQLNEIMQKFPTSVPSKVESGLGTSVPVSEAAAAAVAAAVVATATTASFSKTAAAKTAPQTRKATRNK